jgi:hypothetical protein
MLSNSRCCPGTPDEHPVSNLTRGAVRLPPPRLCTARVQRDGTVAVIDKDSRFMQYGDLVDVRDLVTILIALWFVAEHVVDALSVQEA